MLERFAASLLMSADESTQSSIGLGLVFAGFLIALIVRPWRQVSLRRAPYFALSCFLYLVSSGVSFLWLAIMDAFALGVLWILLAFTYSSILMIGFFYGMLALGRSRDITGNGGYALFGMIPLANLYLILKESKVNASVHPMPTVPILSGGLGVVFGFGMLALGGFLSAAFAVQSKESLATMAADPKAQEASVRLMIEGLGTEAAIQKMATNTPGDFPITVDEYTQLIAVDADGMTLRRTYIVSGPIVNLPESFWTSIEKGLCGHPPFKPLLRAGAGIEEVYLYSNKAPLSRRRVTIDSCST